MPSVATFYQLSQDKTKADLVGGGAPVTLQQSVNVTPTTGEAALVTWMAQRTTQAALTYTVSLNNVVLNSYTVDGPAVSAGTPQKTEKYAMQVSFKTPAVIQGNNVVAFTATTGAGTIEISDVLLWVPVQVT